MQAIPKEAEQTAHENGKAPQAKAKAAKPPRSTMPAPGRKVSAQEAIELTFAKHDELLKRLAK